MKFKINAATIQNMVAKAVKGASVNSNLGLTQLMSISLKNNSLILTTTDGNNYLYVREDKIPGDDFSVVVPVEKFSKLISKQTCEDITFETVEKKGELDSLVIHGNGRYVIELPYDADGELIDYPDPLSEDDGSHWNVTDVNLTTIRLILSTAKAALMLGTEAPQYTGYYVGDRVVATDTYKICGIDVSIFSEPRLVSARMMDLLDVMSEEKVSVRYNADTIIFMTDKVAVYGPAQEGIEEFQIEAISSLLDEQFKSSCKVDKTRLLQLLERLSLFVDVLDKNSVYLTFTKDGLNVASKKDSGSETLEYKESENFQDYTCCLDIDLFKAQVRAYQGDIIEMLYGKENSIKFVSGNCKQILALADDDRVASEE